MHMKILFNKRPDQVLGPLTVPEDPRIFEDAEDTVVSDEEIFQDADEGYPTNTSAQVWDGTRDRVVTCGDVRLKLMKCQRKKTSKRPVKMSLGAGPWILDPATAWSIYCYREEIYHIGGRPTNPSCYKLNKNLNWKKMSSSDVVGNPIAAQMIADVKIGMNFN